MIKTNFVDSDELKKNLKLSIEKLQQKQNQIEKALTEDKVILKKGSYHLLTKLFNAETVYDRILYSHLTQLISKSELIGAGGGYISLVTFIEFANEFLKNFSMVEPYQSKGEEEIRKYNNICTQNIIDETIETFLTDKKMIISLKEAIELAGLEGNIRIENSSNKTFTVELKYGYSFSVKPFKFMIPSFGVWDSYNAKILCIDGFVEKVSEIDKILINSSKTKIPLVIVAQGFSEEVVGTIVTNNNSKKFNILLVKLEQELENINVLNDIAIASGGDVVSVLKGDMLIYTNYDEIPIVENIKCGERELLITNSKTRTSVTSQIKNLLEKKASQQNSFNSSYNLGDLTNKRISNLLSHSVIIKLPEMSDSQSLRLKTDADICLRTIRSLVTYGFIDRNEFLTLTKNKFLKRILEKCVWDKISTVSLFAGYKFGMDTAIEIFKVSGAVVQEN